MAHRALAFAALTILMAAGASAATITLPTTAKVAAVRAVAASVRSGLACLPSAYRRPRREGSLRSTSRAKLA